MRFGVTRPILLLLSLAACAGQAGGVHVAIQPQRAQLKPGCSTMFQAVVIGETENKLVTFSINEGIPQGGTFVYTKASSNAILYTAPPVPGTYHVLARPNADPTQVASARITVVQADGGPCESSST